VQLEAIDERAARIIPRAQLSFLDGAPRVPHLEGNPATQDEIAAFVDALTESVE
jgi:hypothetical protein